MSSTMELRSGSELQGQAQHVCERLLELQLQMRKRCCGARVPSMATHERDLSSIEEGESVESKQQLWQLVDSRPLVGIHVEEWFSQKRQQQR